MAHMLQRGVRWTHHVLFAVWVGTYEAVNTIAQCSLREANYWNLFLKLNPILQWFPHLFMPMCSVSQALWTKNTYSY